MDIDKHNSGSVILFYTREIGITDVYILRVLYEYCLGR